MNKTISKEELENHLYSRPDLPDAIPYVTSYYKPRWGFCISDTQRQQLPDGDYHVFVDADHFDGSLTYGEAFFEGETDDEILISTYVCHPSMANNEISGMAVSTFLARHVANMPSRRFSYRFVFVPETIGSIAFLSQNLNALKAKVKAGFNLTCIGDDRSYSFLLPGRAILSVIVWRAMCSGILTAIQRTMNGSTGAVMSASIARRALICPLLQLWDKIRCLS